MRYLFGMVSLVALTACNTAKIPDSAAHLPSSDAPQSMAPLSATIEVAAISTQPLGATTPVPVVSAPAAQTPAAQAPAPSLNGSGISDEQDFAAVSSRETIASDAARLAQNRAQYQQVAPVALPKRPSGTGLSIVDYALSTTNAVGEQAYRRSGLKNAKRTARNCAKYGSPDLAQAAFLKNGGPKKDRKGLDPDGDGFACDWTPNPFRAAKGAGIVRQPVVEDSGVSAADLQALGISAAETLNISTE